MDELRNSAQGLGIIEVFWGFRRMSFDGQLAD
jgi:hypothetical protein